MRIFLVGFMCSGKTTLGQALAKRLVVPFYDLDDVVESKEGMKISEIFAAKGEAAFRFLEAQALAELASEDNAVVACGGGTPCREEAWKTMRACGGFSVWLKPEDTGRLIDRLIDGRAKRPLISDLNTAEQMYAFYNEKMRQREPHYAKADAIFDSSFLENDAEIEASIDRFIDLLKNHGK